MILLDLPCHLVHCVLREWLPTLKDASALDRAFTNHKDRRHLLEVLTGLSFATEDRDNDNDEVIKEVEAVMEMSHQFSGFLHWIHSRRVSLLHLVVPIAEVSTLCVQHAHTRCRSIRSLELCASAEDPRPCPAALLQLLRLFPNCTHLLCWRWRNIADEDLAAIARSRYQLFELELHGLGAQLTAAAVQALVLANRGTLEKFTCSSLTDAALLCIMEGCKALTSMGLSCDQLSTAGLLTAFAGRQHLEYLQLCMESSSIPCPVTDMLVVDIARACPRLVSLLLHRCPTVSAAVLPHVFSSCPDITEAAGDRFRYETFDCDAEHIQQHPMFCTISLSTDCADDILCLLQRCRLPIDELKLVHSVDCNRHCVHLIADKFGKDLTVLYLPLGGDVDNSTLEYLFLHCPKLVTAYLHGCHSLQDDLVARLPAICPLIRCLGLEDGCSLTDSSLLALLDGYKQLDRLLLNGCRQLTDNVLCKLFDRFPLLRRLCMQDTAITQAGVLSAYLSHDISRIRFDFPESFEKWVDEQLAEVDQVRWKCRKAIAPL